MRHFYEVLVGGEFCTPAEFWQLKPYEVYWLIEAKTKHTKARKDAEGMEECYQVLMAAKEQEAQANG